MVFQAALSRIDSRPGGHQTARRDCGLPTVSGGLIGCVAGLGARAALMVLGGLLYGFFARRSGSRCRFGRFVLGLPSLGKSRLAVWRFF